MKLTIDEMIAALQAQKAAGAPGATQVGLRATDNNGVGGFVALDVSLVMSAVSKTEHDNGWPMCRKVARGGVSILLIC